MSISVLSRVQLVGLFILVSGCGGDRVGELVAQLEQGDVAMRRDAARALEQLTEPDDRVVAGFARALSDSDGEVRRLSAVALGEFGPAAKPSVPALKAALEDPDVPVRRAAALAITRIDPQERSFVPVLVAAMRDGDGPTILEVGAMGEEAEWAVPTLVGLLSHDRPPVRALAAQTLGRIGPAARDGKPALERALRDPNVAVQTAARAALSRIQGSVAPSESDRPQRSRPS